MPSAMNATGMECGDGSIENGSAINTGNDYP
jgi:hypothetical protein